MGSSSVIAADLSLGSAPANPYGGEKTARRGLALQREGFAEVESAVRGVLRDVLGLSAERAAAFREDTPLFGALPELDSLAVAGVLTEIEDRLGILIEDDEVDGEMLESFGALTRFAADKALA
jgi:acyl carrier protein